MTAKKLTEAEMQPLRIASLPTRPTAPTAFGGVGYTSVQMKEAFDLLPNLIAERLNALIDDVSSGALSEAIPKSGCEELPTLADALLGIKSGALADAITVLGASLTSTLAKLRADVNRLAEACGVTL